MTIIADLIVGMFVLGAAMLPVGLFWRCRRVDALRSEKLRESYEHAMTDMNSGESWEWRFDAYRTGPTFTEMVWKMWRPVSSFYQERRPGSS